MMIPLAKQPDAGAIAPPGAVLRAIVLSVLLSAALLLFRQYGWAQPLPGVALPLSLALAFACGVALGRYRPLAQPSPLVVARYGLLIAAAGLLWILLALHGRLEWTMLLPGAWLTGAGLGAVYQRHRASAPPGRHPVWGRAALALICGAALAATQWLQWQAAGGFNFAFALLVDMVLFGALLVRIVERDRES
ncbi:hypothetical protein ACWA06_04785 [Serratia rhizosphaerae]|uniref:hypothetical protein n=1 Tax=Serratia sp. Tan611 TaxID=2773264 RepID=UPI0019344EAA|nr:hypothetical protein [Serratia sp. Tan611]CAE1147836.1 conserved membrane protein of unknown function [Serratia sp. Tan611]